MARTATSKRKPAVLMKTAPGRSAASTVRTLAGAKAKADRLVLIFEATKDGKLRVSSSSWDEPLVILPGRELVIRNIDNQANVFDAAQ